MIRKKFQKTFTWTTGFPTHSAYSVQIASFAIPDTLIVASWVLLPMVIFILAILRGVI